MLEVNDTPTLLDWNSWFALYRRMDDSVAWKHLRLFIIWKNTSLACVYSPNVTQELLFSILCHILFSSSTPPTIWYLWLCLWFMLSLNHRTSAFFCLFLSFANIDFWSHNSDDGSHFIVISFACSLHIFVWMIIGTVCLRLMKDANPPRRPLERS